MADITFCVRGNSPLARYSTSGKTPYRYTPSGVYGNSGTSSYTGEIGGSSLNFNSGQNKYVYYPGYRNLPQTRGISVLIRCSLENLSSYMGLWAIGVQNAVSAGTFYLTQNNTNGNNIVLYDFNNPGANVGVNNTATAWTVSTGTLYDFLVTWDGLTTTNGVKLYQDGSLIRQDTSARAWPATIDPTQQPSIQLGGIPTVPFINGWINEFVIWSGVVDPTNVLLTSGVGSLNGNSRTAFVDCIEYDGTTASTTSGGGSQPALGMPEFY